MGAGIQALPENPCASIVFPLTSFSYFSLNFFFCFYLETLSLFLTFPLPQSGLDHFPFAVKR